jgi:hypothetical protein
MFTNTVRRQGLVCLLRGLVKQSKLFTQTRALWLFAAVQSFLMRQANLRDRRLEVDAFFADEAGYYQACKAQGLPT